MTKLHTWLACPVVAGLMAWATPAPATLGEAFSEGTAQPGTAAVRQFSTSHASYTDHLATQDSGLQIHEYADASGIVFAVTWNGPAKPNLSELLGTYFPAYQESHGQTPSGSLTQFHANYAGLVIHTGGHGLNFSGRIYLADQVPEGVSAETLP